MNSATDSRCLCCPALAAFTMGSALVCVSSHPELQASPGEPVGRRNGFPPVSVAAADANSFEGIACLSSLGVAVTDPKLTGPDSRAPTRLARDRSPACDGPVTNPTLSVSCMRQTPTPFATVSECSDLVRASSQSTTRFESGVGPDAPNPRECHLQGVTVGGDESGTFAIPAGVDLDRDFWPFVEKTATCWEWTGPKNSKGYGQLPERSDRPRYVAHRISYMAHKGPIPAGLLACHDCDNRGCVNPSHLWGGTGDANMADMAMKDRGGVRPEYTKISNDDVLSVRAGETQQSVADRFGIDRTTVSRIVNGNRRFHVGESAATNSELDARPDASPRLTGARPGSCSIPGKKDCTLNFDDEVAELEAAWLLQPGVSELRIAKNGSASSIPPEVAPLTAGASALAFSFLHSSHARTLRVAANNDTAVSVSLSSHIPTT